MGKRRERGKSSWAARQGRCRASTVLRYGAGSTGSAESTGSKGTRTEWKRMRVQCGAFDRWG